MGKSQMPSQISDYIFETLLGQGTFGSVYLVRRKRDLKPFVVKKQTLSNVDTLSFKITLAEVECLQKMRHPNIVAYYAAWIEENHSYILMEYATRCTLKDLLEKRQIPLKNEDALHLFSQIVLGVHHIHHQNILHRDLKPENIMLTGSRGDIIKIGDFGLSKNLEELKHRSIMCRAGSFYYMAPEMLTGQSYDFKCDIWSMGVVLYEMISKSLPFPGTTVEEIIEGVTKKKPQPFRLQISPAVLMLTSKMLKKSAAERPRTEQILTCPHLVPFIVRVYLNVGRTPNVLDNSPKKCKADLFLRYLTPCLKSSEAPI